MTRKQELEYECSELKKSSESLRREAHNLGAAVADQREAMERNADLIADATEKARQLEETVQASTAKVSENEARAAELRSQIETMEANRTKIASELETFQSQAKSETENLQNRLVRLRQDDKALTKKVDEAKEGVEAQLLKLREGFELTKAKVMGDESQHIQQMKLDAAQKFKKMESDMIAELMDKKERIGREISLTVETFFKTNPSERNLETLQKDLKQLLDGQIVMLSKDPGAKGKQQDLVAMKRAHKWQTRAIAAAVGGLLFYSSQYVYITYLSEASPLQRRVAALSEETKADLERRKFNPPKGKDLKPSYTDAVIYTDSFVATYSNDDFQKKFMKELVPHMLKTWRLEEDKTIEVLAAAASLVKELDEKRSNIHPDFVPQGIQKMRDLEAQSVDNMTKILGSNVRYESFKKFEHQFFDKYRAENPGRLPATNNGTGP
jgi:chromosome segregation ATPase